MIFIVNNAIRVMTLADLPRVHFIEQQVQSHPWSQQLFIDSIQAGHQCTVLELDGTIAGFCILQKVLDEANLLLMAIASEYQKQGLGYQLLEQSIQALGTGCNMIFLEVRQSNQAAIALYEKMGFAQIDLRKNYYPTAQGKEHAVIMALTLGNVFA
ncbi:ribosomal protein S18-alanine N-acetyltransferase [Alkanindiges sp. WGS2144]|uniref:ribosomal protein S18-alanine N-acetyltransferase n=1 Tax=Alkanindiges sp. WGS2144 TaxID=3366808 RepID=UPI0037518AB0